MALEFERVVEIDAELRRQVPNRITLPMRTAESRGCAGACPLTMLGLGVAGLAARRRKK
jgi:hypothetical protein